MTEPQDRRQQEDRREQRVSLSVKQYAERHGICTRTVHRWIKSGRVPVQRLSKRTLRIVIAVRRPEA